MAHVDIKQYHTSNFLEWISTGADVLGAIFGATGQDDTNDTNERIAREQNEMNYKIHQEDMAFNASEAEKNRQFQQQTLNQQQAFARQQYEDQLAYNDPSAQRERWENAGFSAWTLAGQGNAGTAQSVTPGSPSSGSQAQAPSAPNMIAPQYQSPLVASLANFRAMSSAVLGIGEYITGKKSANSQIALNEANAAKAQSESLLNRSLTQLNSQEYAHRGVINPYVQEMTKYEKQYNEAILNERIQSFMEDVKYKKAVTQAQQLDNDKQALLLQWLPMEKFMNYNIMCEQYSNLVLQGKLTVEQAKTEAYKRLEYLASAKLKEQMTETEKQNTRMAKSNADIAENAAFDANIEHSVKKYRQNDLKKIASDMIDNNMHQLVVDGLQLNIDSEILGHKRKDRDKYSWIYERVDGSSGAYDAFGGLTKHIPSFTIVK